MGRPTPDFSGFTPSPVSRSTMAIDLMERNSKIRATPRLMFAMVLTVLSGCTTVKTTGTAHGDRAAPAHRHLGRTRNLPVDFQPLAGAKVFVHGQYVANVDKEWIISSIRRHHGRTGSPAGIEQG